MSEMSISMSVVWSDVEATPLQRANSFVCQVGPGPDGLPEDLILIAGHVAPPIVMGSPEEQASMMQAMGALTATTLARLSLSEGRAVELIELLTRQLDAIRQARGGATE